MTRWMAEMKLLKRLFCTHKNQECITNIHGDLVNAISHKKIIRSVWECKDCGKIICKSELSPDCKVVNFNFEAGRKE